MGPKSLYNPTFCWRFMLSLGTFDISVGIRAFVKGPSQISSFLLSLYYTIPYGFIILLDIIQWWFVNTDFDNPEISLIWTKSAETDFLFWTDWRFSNPENSLFRKCRPRTKVSGLTNHHCISNFTMLCLANYHWRGFNTVTCNAHMACIVN